MKKILFLFTLITGLTSLAQTYEPFAFTGALNAGGWTTHSGIAGQLSTLTTASTTGNSLDFTGITTPTGNRAMIDNSSSEDVNYPLPVITGDVVYYSLIINVNNTTGLSTSGNYFFGLGGTAGGTVTSLHARLHTKVGATPNTFQIGITNSGSSETYDATDYAVNTNHFVVVRYDKSVTPAVAEVFVNPTPGGTQPATSNVSNTASTSVIGAFASLFIRQSSGTGNTEIDEIRADNTWAGVTPGGVPSCNIASSGLASLNCNDAGTGSVTLDDYLTFDLDPTGTLLGTTYTVSVSSGSITPTTGTYGAAASFQLQAGSAGAGNVTVTITDAGTAGCSATETITDPGACSSVIPTIELNPGAIQGFDHTVGTPSAEQTFMAGGLGLTDDITLTASADFEISLTTGTGFATALTLPQAAGIVSPTTIYTRGNSLVQGAFNGSIVGTSAGAVNDTVLVSGVAADYVYSTIDLISTVDVDGIAVSMDQLVELTGVVHCMDFDGNSGYSLTMIDESMEGINLFSFNDVSGYTAPMEGDSVRVFGEIGQYNGLLQVAADSIELLAQGVGTMSPTVVTILDESTESQYIQMDNLNFVTPIATFPTGSTNIDVTDGTNTFTIRVDSDTDIPGAAAPQGLFSVVGVGGQFDNSAPLTDGYQLFPCGLISFQPACLIPSNATTTTNPSTAMATAMGPDITYQWINCVGDTTIAGATSQSYTATAAGNYAVIVMAGSPSCSDTSSCIALESATQGLNENALFYAINVYPNPVNDVLTINNSSNTTLTFVVVDINGKVISTVNTVDNSTTISTSNWNKGVYFVKFTSESASAVFKIVK
ncbi:T9SS type A sorting domain-containing protein [Crocinitomicaceae bacterium]|nr:T9SS type A sorting domain-containing protein [Crocinitomicaceae bacterium]